VPNPTRFPSIEALQTFEAACRLGSFEKAADALDVTSSAVSKRIAGLEELLGATLIERSGRSLKLTVAGKDYLLAVRGVLVQLSSIALHQRSTQARERLRVVLPPTFAREVLVPRLASFTQAHAGLDIEIIVAIPYLDIAPPDAEVRIGFGTPGQAGEPLLFELTYAYAAPELIAHFELQQPQDLKKVPLLRCPLEPWAPWFAAAELDWPEPTSNGAPTLVDLGLVLEAAASGQGVALARPALARRFLQRGELVQLFDISSRAGTGYCLRVERASDAALAFASWVQALCRGLAQER
jgi:LysR family transcriptional regulator, glycine cleavage system transcriptional activator